MPKKGAAKSTIVIPSINDIVKSFTATVKVADKAISKVPVVGAVKDETVTVAKGVIRRVGDTTKVVVKGVSDTGKGVVKGVSDTGKGVVKGVGKTTKGVVKGVVAVEKAVIGGPAKSKKGKSKSKKN